MIPLYVNGGVAYVWNVDDWHTLRSNHQICGALIGAIASFPRQNDFLGLPMALSSEEAALLVEKSICELYELPNITQKPTREVRENVKETEERVIEEQKEELRKRRIETLSQKIDIIVAGKKQKLASKGITNVNLDRETMLQEEINKLPPLALGHVLVHLPTEHFLDTEKVKISIEALKPSVTEGEGRIRYKVFKDLWEKGHYITSGMKFGSDYLVYPGDPVRFHAMYMVRCISDPSLTFDPANIVAFGRLSVSVNKLAVFAYCNDYGHIEYQTLQWHDSIHV